MSISVIRSAASSVSFSPTTKRHVKHTTRKSCVHFRVHKSPSQRQPQPHESGSHPLHVTQLTNVMTATNRNALKRNRHANQCRFVNRLKKLI
jgi:hypothetical protein